MSPVRRPRTRSVALGILAVALLLAGVVSFYAAGSPDGLDRVALDKGFSGTETEHGTGSGPFAGYGTSFIEDSRLSSGLAGVLGVLVVLLLAGGLGYVVRRRGTAPVIDRWD